MRYDGRYNDIGSKRTGVIQKGLGERVKRLRKERGMTQVELAEGICTDATISGLERGTINVSIDILVGVAEKLRVPLKEIYRPDIEGEFPNPIKLDLVQVYISRGDLKSAQELLEQLNNRDDLVAIEVHKWHYLQAKVWNDSKMHQRSIDLLIPILEQLEASQFADESLMCKLYNQLGNAYYYTRQFAKALSAYERGYSYVLRMPVFQTDSAHLTYNLGIVCNELELRQDADHYLNKARNYYESVSDLRKLADSYFQSAIATKNENYINKAKHYYEELELQDMVNMVRQFKVYHIDSRKDYRLAVEELHSIALDFYNMNKIERCIYTLSRAVMLCVKNSDTLGANIYVSLATTYKEELNSDNGMYIPDFYLMKAKYYYACTDYPESLKHAYKASELYDKMDMKAYSADALKVAVKVLRDMQRVDEALNVALLALEKVDQERRN